MKIQTLSSAIVLSTFLATSPSSHASKPMKNFIIISHNQVSENDQVNLALKRSLIDQFKADFIKKEAFFQKTDSIQHYINAILNLITEYENAPEKDTAAIDNFMYVIKELPIIKNFMDKREDPDYAIPMVSTQLVLNAGRMIQKHGTEEQKKLLREKNAELDILVTAADHFGLQIDPQKLEQLRTYQELRNLLLELIQNIEAIQ